MIAVVVVLAIAAGLFGGLVLALLEDRRARAALLLELVAERDTARTQLAGARARRWGRP